MGKQIGIVGAAVLFVACWSSGFIGAKLGAADASVPTVLMWRFLPLALLLTPFLRPGSMRELGRHVLIGLLSQSGYLLTVYWAIGEGVSTGTTALIDGVQPLVAAALAGPLLGVAATGRQWIGLALGLVGVVLVSWSDAASHAPAWAYLIPFAGMLGLVASTVLERRARVPAPPLRALAVHCATSAVVFTVLALATGNAVPPASGHFWFALAWLIVLATFGGYGLYWLLVGRIGMTAVNSLMFLIAPVTSVWGTVLFGEPFTVLTGVGLGLALVAAVVANGRVSRRSVAGPPPESPGSSPRRCSARAGGTGLPPTSTAPRSRSAGPARSTRRRRDPTPARE